MPRRRLIFVQFLMAAFLLISTSFSSGNEGLRDKRIDLLASEWKRDPTNLRVGLLLGRMLREEGREAEAKAVVGKSVDLVKESSAETGDLGESEYLLGMGALFLDQNYLALQRFQSALSLDPEREEIHLGLIRTQMRLGKEDEALMGLELARTLFPESEAIKAQLAEIYERQGRYDEAILYLEELRFLYPDNNSFTNRLLNAHIELGQLEEAEALIDSLVELGQIEALTAKLYAFRLLVANGDVRGARVALQEAMSLDADDPRVGAAFADYYALQAEEAEAEGNFRRALIFWERAYERNPDDFRIRHRFALANAMVGDHSKALEQYLPLLELKPAYPEFYADLSQTLIETERLEAAARVLRLGRELVSEKTDEQVVSKLNAVEARLREIASVPVDAQ